MKLPNQRPSAFVVSRCFDFSNKTISIYAALHFPISPMRGVEMLHVVFNLHLGGG